jgi:hypothetical protein
MKIHFNITTNGQIDWQGDLVLYKQIQFIMSQFREMVYGLVIETKWILQGKLIFITNDNEILSIP